MEFQSAVYPCPEVQISINFLRLVATEVIIFVLKHPMKWLAYKLKLCLKRAMCGAQSAINALKKQLLKISEVSFIVLSTIIVHSMVIELHHDPMVITNVLPLLHVVYTATTIHTVPLYAICDSSVLL